MIRPRLRHFCLWVAAVAVLASPAVAADACGHVVRVAPGVSVIGPSGQRLVELQDAVFEGDEIVAGASGAAQIKFIDDSRMVVGPNSRVRLDTMVFNADNTAKEVVITVVEGTFRFIQGKSERSAYTICTSTGTINLQ